MPATAVAAVKAQTNPQCHATCCSDNGCTLSIVGAPAPYALIYMEHPASPVRKDQPHCDYLFIGGDDSNGGPWVVPIELTTGRKRAVRLTAQIEGGVAIADNLLPQELSYRFHPVAAYCRPFHPKEIADLRKSAYRVDFRGQLRNITLVECGSHLLDALPQ